MTKPETEHKAWCTAVKAQFSFAACTCGTASPTAPSVPDDLTADLMRFYDVKTVPELIAAQYRHIQRLQDKLPKPRDDFPVSPRHG